jgi:hypothetical protein
MSLKSFLASQSWPFWRDVLAAGRGLFLGWPKTAVIGPRSSSEPLPLLSTLVRLRYLSTGPFDPFTGPFGKGLEASFLGSLKYLGWPNFWPALFWP